jgi:hypothetical protein
MARKPTDDVQLKLRFKEALRRQLERAAADNNRSINAEIISRLESTFEAGDRLAETTAQYVVTLLEGGLLKEIARTAGQGGKS